RRALSGKSQLKTQAPGFSDHRIFCLPVRCQDKQSTVKVRPPEAYLIGGFFLLSFQVEMVVRLWKDGFTVNDEDFRSYSIPENQEFLDAIKRGELPAEWESRAEEEELEISVEDLTEENYVPKKKAFHPFSGRGYRLGSVAPRVVARSPSVHEDGESPPIPMVTLDHALPVTSLQIWLADGRRLVQRFNLSHRYVSPIRHISIFAILYIYLVVAFKKQHMLYLVIYKLLTYEHELQHHPSVSQLDQTPKWQPRKHPV
uniref:UBX domain protein 2A n=1 Tax=Neolamprologus brichardi TaxID=32507 RepID=A0A3Q4HUT9_NEOBR